MLSLPLHALLNVCVCSSVHKSVSLPALAFFPHWIIHQKQYRRGPLPSVPGDQGSDLVPAAKQTLCH